MHSFKRTLLKALAFILAVLLVTAAIVEPYYQNEIYHYQDAHVRDQYAGSLDVLVCGSSHAYRAVVPQVLDEALGCNSYNLACSLMTMAGRYELLKKELERNPVELVILDISFNCLTRNRDAEGPEGDLYQLGRYTNPLERAAYFFKHIRLDEYGSVFYDSLNRGIQSIRSLRSGKGATGSSPKYETKGFAPAPHSRLEPLPAAQMHSFPLSEKRSEESAKYLEKILRLCQSHNITVIPVVIPISQDRTLYYSNLDSVMADCQSFLEEWGLPLYDFNLYRGKTQLFPDTDAYYDAIHMSESGAYAFTEALTDLILRLENGENVSHLFYSSYAEAEEAALAGLDTPAQ